VKIVFMGTAAFAVPSLKGLREAGHEIALVVCQPDRPKGRGHSVQACDVKRAALELGLELFQPLKVREVDAVERIRAKAPDLLCVVAYGQILPKTLLEAPRRLALNVHASLLPKYRGAAPIEWAVAEGETQTGVCVQAMAERLDSGPVLARAMADIAPLEDAQSLTQRLSVLGADLLLKAVESIGRHEEAFEAQDEAMASYAPLLKKKHGAADFRLDAAKVMNHFRAFKARPGFFTLLNQETLRISGMSASSAPVQAAAQAGILRSVGKSGFEIGCGDGKAVWVTAVQGQGSRAMPAEDYARGHGVKAGMRAELPHFEGVVNA
jgi:methionyl-tRNA formyltransferase